MNLARTQSREVILGTPLVLEGDRSHFMRESGGGGGGGNPGSLGGGGSCITLLPTVSK